MPAARKPAAADPQRGFPRAVPPPDRGRRWGLRRAGGPPRRWLWLTLGGIVVAGLAIAAYIYSGRKAAEGVQQAAFDKEQATNQFIEFARQRIGADITRAGRDFGFCPTSCERFSPAGGALQTWQFRTPDAVLVVFLFGGWSMMHKAPEYWLKFQWASTRDDGDLAPVAPRLQQLLDSLLQQYNFPRALLGQAQVFTQRGNSGYEAKLIPYRPNVRHIYTFAGHERLRGERTASIIRTGPFTEEGAWLREK